MAEGTTTSATDGTASTTDKGGASDDKGTDAAAAANGNGSGTAPATDIEAIAAQADKPDAVRSALNAERAAAAAERKRADELAAKVKDFEDRDKSEQQKLEERANGAEDRATKAESKLLRFEVATAKKLPLELADRLQGDTKKDLEADADRLLELVKPNGRPAGDADAGKGDAVTGGTFNDLVRQQARR